MLNRVLVLPALILATIPPTNVAAQERWRQTSISTGFDYSSGRYGREDATSVLFLPTTLSVEDGNWIAKITMPWLRVDGPALVIDGVGDVGDREGVSEGIGDVSVSASYGLEALYDSGWYVDLTARFKAPSASFEKGLGTGEPDFSGQIDVATKWGDVVPFATVGYTLVGNPAGFDLRDRVYASFGAQVQVIPDLTLGAAFDYRQASNRDVSDQQELLAYVSWRWTDAWAINVYGTAGFTDNSADAGGGLQLSWRGLWAP